MKVILLKDVSHLGKKYDVKEVSDGHALNFLIPRGLAQVATDTLVKKIEADRVAELEHRKKEEAALAANLAQISGGKPIELTEKANEKGHLFSAIHKDEIVAAIKKASGIELPKEFIKLEKPIKEIGDHLVEIGGAGKTVKVKISIKAAQQ